jgi:coatomer subunit beta'
MAFDITPDQDHKFDLALQLNRVKEAYEIAEKQNSSEKFRKVGDIALMSGQFSLAEQCFEKSQDYNSLLLFYSSYGNEEGLQRMADSALKAGKFNIAFEAYFVLQNTNKCIEVLLKSKRVAEAAIFAQAYAPSALPALVK